MKIAIAGGTGVVGSFATIAARERGHDVVVLSRSRGIDLQRDDGVARAFEGVDVIIDASNISTLSGKKASAFFLDVTNRLQTFGAAAGVQRLITLSIIGVDRARAMGYYDAKYQQEERALEGPVPATIVRAAQFFEFPVQMMRRSRLGPVAPLMHMRIQPVAARSVGDFLAELASSPTTDNYVEIAGPEEFDLVAMSKTIIERAKSRLHVVASPIPGKLGNLLRSGGLLPGPAATLRGPTFNEWLETDDARESLRVFANPKA